MATTVSLTLDAEAMRALALLQATGESRSEAIRAALIEAAARLGTRALAAEVAVLDAEEDDHSEMIAMTELMEHLRTPG